MNKVKEVFGTIFLRIIPITVAIIGIFAIGYGLYFQTEGFTLAGLNVYILLLAIFIGMIVGGAMARYLDKQFSNPHLGKKARTQGVNNMVTGLTIFFFISIVVLYYCTSFVTLYLGIACGLYSWSGLAWHFGLILFKKLKDKKNSTEEKKA